MEELASRRERQMVCLGDGEGSLVYLADEPLAVLYQGAVLVLRLIGPRVHWATTNSGTDCKGTIFSGCEQVVPCQIARENNRACPHSGEEAHESQAACFFENTFRLPRASVVRSTDGWNVAIARLGILAKNCGGEKKK